ncbi:hypothetical protein BD324DRAFT_633626, partial [Kockovaella imperatae]
MCALHGWGIFAAHSSMYESGRGGQWYGSGYTNSSLAFRSVTVSVCLLLRFGSGIKPQRTPPDDGIDHEGRNSYGDGGSEFGAFFPPSSHLWWRGGGVKAAGSEGWGSAAADVPESTRSVHTRKRGEPALGIDHDPRGSWDRRFQVDSIMCRWYAMTDFAIQWQVTLSIAI